MSSVTVQANHTQVEKVKEYLGPVLKKLDDYGYRTDVHSADREVPVMFSEGNEILGLRNIRTYLLALEKKARPSGKRKIPNVAKTVEGKWYPFPGEFKIEETERKYYNDGKTRSYRITIRKFPSKHRTGIIPTEIVLENNDESGRSRGASYYYGVSEHDVREDIFKLIESIQTNSFEVEEHIRVLKSKLTPRQ